MKKQSDLFQAAGLKNKYNRTVHGGKAQLGRKNERPLSKKQPIHLVLKSERAKGVWSFLSLKNKPMIETIVRQKAKKFGIKICDFANVGNHLHLKIKIQHREGFQNFLRSITTLIARKVTGARRGHALKGKFWKHLAFTRVLKSFREELYLRGYFISNHLDAYKGYQAREKFRLNYNDWVKGLSP